jgi:hypothetical protein
VPPSLAQSGPSRRCPHGFPTPVPTSTDTAAHRMTVAQSIAAVQSLYT